MYRDVPPRPPGLYDADASLPCPVPTPSAINTGTPGAARMKQARRRHTWLAAWAVLITTGTPAWAEEPAAVTPPVMLVQAQLSGQPTLDRLAINERTPGAPSRPLVLTPQPAAGSQWAEALARRPTGSAAPSVEPPSTALMAPGALASAPLVAPPRPMNLTPQLTPPLQLTQAEQPGRRLIQPMPQNEPIPRQAPPPAPAQGFFPGRAIAPPPPPVRQQITLSAGTGQIVQLPSAAVSVIAAEPRIARVEPTSQSTLFVMGVSGGRTTIVATAENGAAIAEYDVTVIPTATADQPNARPPMPSAVAMQASIRQSVTGAQGVRVATVGRNGFVLNGTISNASDSQRAETIARIFAGLDFNVVNNLQLLSAIQVNVRVRIAEVSRQVTRELGLNWRAFGQTGSFLMGLRSGPAALTAAAAVASGGSSLAASPARIALGLTGNNYDINAVVDALAADNLISILAEPNLTAQSGETASFLAGGEFPIPVGAGQNGQITIEFKQFGVSLAFVPTVLATDRVNLRIRPEVSELSEQGAVTVPLGNGGGTVTIPALSVRRAETTVELGSGQSFAIAGLLQRNSRQAGSGIAGLGEIPVLGALFRSNRFQRNETELIIIVTPYLVRPVSDPGQLAAPTDGFRPATDIDRVLFQRQIVRGGPATPQIRSRPDAGFILE